MKKILVAGATGYLGGYIVKELQQRDMRVRALARDAGKVRQDTPDGVEIFEADSTDPQSIEGCCRDIEAVVSTVGITRQKDGLTYMDVDYQANLNLLDEAKKSGVQKFVYISALKAEELGHLKICEAKERFVEELKRSGMAWCIVRPNGFYSDMTAYLDMARRGRIYLFGKGQYRTNPIHGADLAIRCADAISQEGSQEIDIGGPQTLSHEEIAHLAFQAVNKQVVITCIPDWMRKAVLWVVRRVAPSTFYGPVEFFLTVMAMDMLAPEYGTRTLQDHFAQHTEI